MSLYPPPTDVATTLFSRLPDTLRLHNQPSGWVDANKPGQAVDSFLEGPSFDRNGNLYLVDIPYGRILQVSPDGEWQVVTQYDGWPNGLKIHADGRLFIADYQHGIMVLAPGQTEVKPYLTHVRSESFKGVNDLIFDSQGRLYFTDQGQTGMQDPSGRVYRYDPATNRLDCLINTGISPNGLALSPDEKTLYVAMTRGNAVWRLPLVDNAPLTKVGIFVQMAGGVSGADGVAVDESGTVYVADAGNGCVWSFDASGRPLHRYPSCAGGRTVTNLAFGGADRKTLYMVDSSQGVVFQAQVDTPGLGMFSHRGYR